MARWRSSLWTIPIGVTCCQPPWLARSRLRWMIWRPIRDPGAGGQPVPHDVLRRSRARHAGTGRRGELQPYPRSLRRLSAHPEFSASHDRGDQRCGGGRRIQLALACDVRVAAETARFVCRSLNCASFPAEATAGCCRGRSVINKPPWRCCSADVERRPGIRVGLVADVVDRARWLTLR